MRFNKFVLFGAVLFASIYVEAHDGFFIRFSVGPDYYWEQATLNESGFATPAKNHALGWGFHEKYALQISDFGGLIKNSVGKYNYINLDALGLGFTYYLPYQTSVTFSIGQGNVTFAKDWWEITNDGKESGYALNLSLDNHFEHHDRDDDRENAVAECLEPVLVHAAVHSGTRWRPACRRKAGPGTCWPALEETVAPCRLRISRGRGGARHLRRLPRRAATRG